MTEAAQNQHDRSERMQSDRDTLLNRIEKSPDIPSLVARQIIERITSGALQPGDKLPSEHEMTAQFGISRISLREAMKLLVAKGFIESQGRRGKFIRAAGAAALESTIEEMISVDHAKIWELLAVRRIIDSEAAGMAARDATRAQVARLRKFDTEVRGMGIPNLIGTREGGKLYARFYNDLADATNNTIYAQLMKSISTLLRGVLPYGRQKLMPVPGVSEIFYRQHVKMIEAIARKDQKLARESVIEHLDWLEKTLKKILK